MWIKQIVLKNWRAYKDAVFDIPYSDKNVIIIGAKNGVGKTSLLEAAILCLYGEKGIDSLGRANRNNIRSDEYKIFMDSVFYTGAESPGKTSVTLVFKIDDDNEMSVERDWHFGSDKKYRGDEIKIKKNGRDIEIPTLPSLENRVAYLDQYIAEKFMPPSLSQFFLFDGVQVQNMARRQGNDLVKEGIEAILGVPILRTLISDLHDYANIRRSGGRFVRAGNARLNELNQKINEAERKIKELTKESEKLNNQKNKAEKYLAEILEKFTSMGGDNVADSGNLQEELGGLKKEYKRLFDQLIKLLSDEFAISLAGNKMIADTCSRLRGEDIRKKWEYSKNDGGTKYKKFLANLDRERALNLPLPKEHISKLREDLKNAWNNVWYPPPKGCAENLLNPDFSDREREDAIAYLEQLSNVGSQMVSVKDKLRDNEKTQENIKGRINSIRGDNKNAAKELRDTIEEKRKEIENLDRNLGNCEREKKFEEGNLAQMRQEASRIITESKDREPDLYRSERAENATLALEEIIKKSYTQHIGDIARKMTSAYIKMSNKDVVEKIKINDNCDIKLLTSQERDLSELELSHGESEIFALALIAATVQTSRKNFPFIIDTPLANLDGKHRKEFLSYFSSDMNNQVLFLSTDEEIRGQGQLINLLDPNIAHKFLIEQKRENDMEYNIVQPNCYFK